MAHCKTCNDKGFHPYCQGCGAPQWAEGDHYRYVLGDWIPVTQDVRTKLVVAIYLNPEMLEHQSMGPTLEIHGKDRKWLNKRLKELEEANQ